MFEKNLFTKNNLSYDFGEKKLDVEPSENVLLRLHMASEAFISNSSNWKSISSTFFSIHTYIYIYTVSTIKSAFSSTSCTCLI